MPQTAIPLTGVLLLVAAACGQTDREGEPDESGAAASGSLGTVTYRYDPVLLTAANVQIAIPPGEKEEAYAIKLLPARGVEGSPDVCPGGAEACPVEVQPGLSMALLERPFDLYEQALRSSEMAGSIAPATVAGTEGIAIDGGTEDGLEVEYRLVPVDNRALLIKRQRDGQSPSEKDALEEVVASLDLGD